MPELRWYGVLPKTCDICHRSLKRFFVDGRTRSGPWAVMCPICFESNGVGLGIGKGQKYSLSGRKLV